MTPARMVCYFSVIAGDCVVLKDAAGDTMKVKAMTMNYADFARRVMRYGSKRWSLLYAGPGSFYFTRKP